MDELHYCCDLITGEAMMPNTGNGIFAMMSSRNLTLYTGRFLMNELRRAIIELQGKDPYRDYVDYKMFPHLNKIGHDVSAKWFMMNLTDPDFKFSHEYPVHPLEEMLYMHGREFDRKILKRVNEFIEAERELFYSY